MAERAVIIEATERSDADGYQVRTAELRRWHPLSAFEIHLARAAGVSPEARAWVRLGATITDAIRAEQQGLSPDQARPWLDDGFCAQDAVDAHAEGVPLDVAGAWRAAGFILPDALLLLRDGWTLAEATRQRYIDLPCRDAR
jgi:hypothetical protein